MSVAYQRHDEDAGRSGTQHRARVVSRLSRQDEEYRPGGPNTPGSSAARALWTLAAFNWKSPPYGEMSDPLPLVLAWLAGTALDALTVEIRRQLSDPNIDEDDEVVLMNDLHSIQVTRSTSLPDPGQQTTQLHLTKLALVGGLCICGHATNWPGSLAWWGVDSPELQPRPPTWSGLFQTF